MTRKRHPSAKERLPKAGRAASASEGTKQALNVVMVYQDSLTRQWVTDLWDRVGEVIDSGGIQGRGWRVSELTEPAAFEKAVRAAAEADVLVISIREGGELPQSLCGWIDAWLPKRAGRPGALAALIGVPPQPDAQIGHAHAYLAGVARRGGLDFLPRENRLPAGPLAFSTPLGATPAIEFARP